MARLHSPVRQPLGALALIVLIASPASAQMDIGLHFGPTITTMTGSYIESSGHRIGFVGGAFAEQRLNRRWSVKIGVNVAQRGSFDVLLAGADSLWDYRFMYVEIPAAVHFTVTGPEKPWTFNVFAGGAFSRSLDCEVKPPTQYGFGECRPTTPGGELKSSDVVVQVGVEVVRRFVGGSRFGFDARVSLGTMNVLEGASEASLSARNNALDFRFHLALPLGDRP